MDTKRAAKLLGALAHPVRMEAVQALARAGQAGMTQGSLADTAGIGPTTLAFHLKELIAADLVSHSRKGRSAVYFIQQAGLNELVAHLAANCCTGPVNPFAAKEPMVWSD